MTLMYIGVPCTALDFPAMKELVEDGVNGRLFRDAQGLNKVLVELLSGFEGEEGTTSLQDLRKGVERWRGGGDWSETWDRVLLPHL
jgi:beta-1,4-mannosyltransferase